MVLEQCSCEHWLNICLQLSVFRFTRGSVKFLRHQTNFSNPWHDKPHSAAYTQLSKTTVYRSELALFPIKCSNTKSKRQRQTKPNSEVHVVTFKSHQSQEENGSRLFYISEMLRFKRVLNSRLYSVLINICRQLKLKEQFILMPEWSLPTADS